MSATSCSEEEMLRRAFVDRRADFVVIDSRRQVNQIASANYGMERGWLSEEYHDDGQCTAYTYRLTEKGREHFGVTRQEESSK